MHEFGIGAFDIIGLVSITDEQAVCFAGIILASTVGLAILSPFKCKIGSTAPSVTGLRNLFECHEAASGPVSASPSPTTQATIRSGLSKAAPYACDTA